MDNFFVNEGNPQSTYFQNLVYASFIKVFPIKLLPYKIVNITFSVNGLPIHCVLVYNFVCTFLQLAIAALL